MSPATPSGIKTASLALLLLFSLPFSLPAQTVDASAAKVITADGQVSVYRNDTLWALFADQTVGVGETIVTEEDGFAELELSDGSRFIVYPNSHVVFRKNPGSLRDLLDVFLGRVKVQIQKLGGRSHRYRIFTPTAVISVRGTVFDVDVDQDETTFIIVDDGVVSVTHRLLPSNKEVSVAAGESLVVYRNAPVAQGGVDKVKAARVASDVARSVVYIWSRTGRGGNGSAGGGTAPGGSPGGGLPGDTPAPEPPPPPPAPER